MNSNHYTILYPIQYAAILLHPKLKNTDLTEDEINHGEDEILKMSEVLIL
jgi:hypothetical protein